MIRGEAAPYIARGYQQRPQLPATQARDDRVSTQNLNHAAGACGSFSRLRRTAARRSLAMLVL